MYRRYFLLKILRIIKKNNFDVLDIKNIGFGPLTFLNKDIFKKEKSLNIDYFLNRISEKSVFSIIKLISNRWVIVLRKI